MNPTTDVFEQRMAQLDGGVGALAVASGQSAVAVALLNLAQAGDEIVSFNNLYGGTYSLLGHTFAKFGITVKFVDSADPDNLKAVISKKTKAIYAESIGNPKLNVTDLEAVAALAHAYNLPFVLDNTAAPYILQPIPYGVDIVVYSATKFIGGHGTSLGGVIVDSGRFDWTIKQEDGSSKFPLIADPDPSYHGVNFVEALASLGNIAYITKARVTLLRDLGAALSPFNAFLLLQGLETLHLRMERHCVNALKVAEFLEKHPSVAWVNYPGLATSPEKAKAEKYLKRGCGAIIGFGIQGGRKAGERFIDSLQLVSHVANIGDAKTLAIHPASTKHQQLSEQQQLATGVTPDFIRLSIGLEHIDDILADLDQALRAS